MGGGGGAPGSRLRGPRLPHCLLGSQPNPGAAQLPGWGARPPCARWLPLQALEAWTPGPVLPSLVGSERGGELGLLRGSLSAQRVRSQVLGTRAVNTPGRARLRGRYGRLLPGGAAGDLRDRAGPGAQLCTTSGAACL